MTLETTIPTRYQGMASGLKLLAHSWRRAWPFLALACVFVVSLVGLYALGRSIQDRVGRPGAVADMAPAAIAETARELTRVGWSDADVPVDVLLVTPDYFRAVGWLPRPEMNPKDHLIFMVSENVHDGDLAPFIAPALWIGGRPVSDPGRALPIADSPHHRTVALVFSKPEAPAGGDASVQLVYPTGNKGAPSVMSWEDQRQVFSGESTQDGLASGLSFHLTGASFLALLGGMLASMWPCLFQLTAYFIPSLAGISMGETRGQVSGATRWRVVKMATFFVIGFVVVYTLAGAAAGLAAQSFGTQSIIETWRRPLTIVSGIVMLVLAARIAARSRMPLVCKMPLLSRVSKGKEPSYGSAMIMGLAYATGCATCFGAALLVGMLVYVGVAGAPLTGAAVMFLFSVGMGIPLIIGAALMARVLPLLERLGLHARYLGLMSSAMMVAMAVLLLSDRFMSFSNGVSRFLE